jgi:hypothetical protein
MPNENLHFIWLWAVHFSGMWHRIVWSIIMYMCRRFERSQFSPKCWNLCAEFLNCWLFAQLYSGQRWPCAMKLVTWLINLVTLLLGGTRWRSWLRHCATGRKVAASIPDVVVGIFHWHNSSGSTMVLGLTQPLTEMSTRNISWRV